MNTSVTEAELGTRSAAPRVTLTDLEANIARVHYINAGEAALNSGQPTVVDDPLTLLTICVVVLKNGFTVTGESACASPENYKQDIGERIAFDNAKQKIWGLMGYALKEQLATRVDDAARCAHEAIRLFQAYLGEPNVAKNWDETSEDIRVSCRIGVNRIIDNPSITNRELHDSWIETKTSQGWTYGAVRNDELKQHHCMIPYDDLPLNQRFKDELFSTAVKASLGLTIK